MRKQKKLTVTEPSNCNAVVEEDDGCIVLPFQGVDDRTGCGFGQSGTPVGLHGTTDIHDDDQIFGPGGA